MNDELREWANKKLTLSPLSMRKLGEKIGVSHAKISRILSGEQEGDLGFYLEFAKIFDAIPEMLRAAGILPKHEEDHLTFAELYELGKRLSPQERKELLDYADYLLQKQRRSGGGESTGESDPAPATT